MTNKVVEKAITAKKTYIILDSVMALVSKNSKLLYSNGKLRKEYVIPVEDNPTAIEAREKKYL